MILFSLQHLALSHLFASCLPRSVQCKPPSDIDFTFGIKGSTLSAKSIVFLISNPSMCGNKNFSHTRNQCVTTRWSLGAGPRGNGERMRKWRENEEMKRKWRENEEMKRKSRENEEMEREIHSQDFLILCLFPPSLSISYIKIVTFCRKMLNTALLSRMSQKT